MTPAALPPGITPDDVATALHDFGHENDAKPDTVKAAQAARILLETMSVTTLLKLVPPLWAREDSRRRHRAVVLFGVFIPVLVFMVVGFVLGTFDKRPRVWDYLLYLFSFISILVFKFFTRASPLHNGMMRLLHLRPHVALVPLLIEALGAHAFGESPVPRDRTRALLTRYLPLWCDADGSDLTPYQQKLLLKEIKMAVNAGSVLYRPIGAPRPPVALPDADFALAAIAALRRCRVSSTDARRLSQTLAHLPGPACENDPRYEVKAAAEAYLVQGRR